MSFVKNLRYEMPEKYGQDVPYGTDLEFATIKNRRYAFAGSELNGLQVVDITNPEWAHIVTAYDCARKGLALPNLTRRSAKQQSGFLCLLKRVDRS